MNKKLTTIMLAILFLLIGKVDAATLTQYVGDNYISQTVNEGQQVRLRFVDQTKFLSWTVESGNVTVDTTSPTITFTMPSSDVVIRGNYQGEETGGGQTGGITLSEVATVGAYVKYIPSSTSYTVPTTVSGRAVAQNFNPSNITSWRVFSVDGENVEIISTDSVETLSLGGSAGYINGVQTLNDISAAYVNSTYAISGRSMGYYDEKVILDANGTLGDDMTEAQRANYKTVDANTYSLTYGKTGFPYDDWQYEIDRGIVQYNSSMHHSNGYVWLATRYESNSGYYYGMRSLDSNDVIYTELLYSTLQQDGYYGVSKGVRPVVSLKSGITVTGSGTEDDPYIINESNPSQYTVTYSANGGYGEMNPQSVAQGSSLTLASNAYEHHSKSFLGWSTDATATTATYTNGQTITPTSDMTLYAIWGYIEPATLAASSGWYKGTTDKGTITEINIVSSYTPAGTVTESWNADVDNSGTIKCYVEGTKLTIAGNGARTIKANANSSYLFGNTDASFVNGNEFSSVANINGLSLLDTSAVTNMEDMFSACSALTELDLSNFVTDNVTNMQEMFRYCLNLTELDLSNFNTSNTTLMSLMFDNCETLTELDLSNFNTSNVISISSMFSSCKSLTSLNLSHFNTSKVTSMDGMFFDCNNLIEVDLSNFDTSAVTDMSHMFYNCRSLAELDVSNFVTDNVTDMRSMFFDCISLTELDVSNFVTDNVTNMQQMFRGCSNVTELNVSNFVTNNVTNMSRMFQDCWEVTELDVSNFITNNVTDMSRMFSSCYNLIELDLSNFVTDNVTDMSNMFGTMRKLQQIKIGTNFSFTAGSTSCTLPTPSSTYITGADGNWYKADGTVLTAEEVAAETRTEATIYYAVKPLSATLSVGDYITYKPSSTSYTVPTTVSGHTSDQTFNPSNTTSWRVFSVNGNDIEIISTDSVGELTLNGKTGYAHAVQTLNDMSASFVNPEYATSGRSLGYSLAGLTEDYVDDIGGTYITNYKVAPSWLSYGECDFPYTDSQDSADRSVLNSHGSMYHSSGYVWLASREAWLYTSSTRFYVDIMYAGSNNSQGTTGHEYSYIIHDGNGNEGSDVSQSYGVRPIVKLKSDITVTGSGTQKIPYLINDSNPSQYTVTYSANGGYGEMMPQSVTQGSSLTLSANTYEHGLSFLGWSTSATATSATYTNGQTITPTADMTLYAVW